MDHCVGRWFYAVAGRTFVGLFGLFASQPLILPGDVGIEPSSQAVSFTFVAFCQYIVLSLLIGRVSWVAVMWIPVTTVVTVAASTVGSWFWSSTYLAARCIRWSRFLWDWLRGCFWLSSTEERPQSGCGARPPSSWRSSSGHSAESLSA